MRKSDRLFQLINLLRRYQPITARRLAEELDVSTRSVYRYIDDLSVNGMPVYGDAGKGYRLRDDFELPALNLTPDELDALLVGVRMVCGWTGTALPDSARSLLHKISAGLAETIKGHAAIDAFVPDVRDRLEESVYWERLRLAIKERCQVRLRYIAHEGVSSNRLVYPLGLFYWGGKWTLGAWCTLRAAYRDFRLDRIQQLKVLNEAFAVTPTINLSTYIEIQTQNCRQSL